LTDVNAGTDVMFIAERNGWLWAVPLRLLGLEVTASLLEGN